MHERARRTILRAVIDYFILLYHSVSLAMGMRQHEPQAMTFIEMLAVHVDLYVNKHRKSERKRKERRRNKAPQKKLAGNTKHNEFESSLFIKRT